MVMVKKKGKGLKGVYRITRPKLRGARRMKQKGYVSCNVWLDKIELAICKQAAVKLKMGLATFMRTAGVKFAQMSPGSKGGAL